MTAVQHRLTFGLGLAAAVVPRQGALAADAAQAKCAELRQMCDKALAVVIKNRAEVKAELAMSAGFGCFTSFGICWEFGGSAVATAESKGAKAELGQIMSSDITACAMASAGLAVGVAAAGRKCWQDMELNAAQ